MNDIAMYDFKLFIEKNLKLILTVSIVVFLSLFSLVLYDSISLPETNNNTTNDPEEQVLIENILPNISTEEDIEDLSEEQQKILSNYLKNDSYSFRIAIENSDSSFFTESVILKEILLNEFNFYSLSMSAHENFINIPESILNISRSENSSILKVQIGSGNKEINTKLASYYYELLNTDKLEILNDKMTYMIDSRPVLINIDNTEEQSTTDPINNKNTSIVKSLSSNIEPITIVGLIGILLGLFLGIFVSLIKERYSDIISTIYHVETNDNQEMMKLDAITNRSIADENKLIESALDRKSQKFIILAEEDNESIINHKHFKVNDLYDVKIDNLDEVIIIVESYKSSKKWLSKQLEILKILKVPVKILRITAKNN